MIPMSERLKLVAALDDGRMPREFIDHFIETGEIDGRLWPIRWPIQYVEARPSEKWDRRLLELARFVSSWSKDPSTQTGAVIADPRFRIVSVGYNGFPRGVEYSEARLSDRELKYKLIIHCERNALLFAQRSVEGCTLYTWPLSSCAPCAAMVIQAGIRRCVYPPLLDTLRERWGADVRLAGELFKEVGIECVEVGL